MSRAFLRAERSRALRAEPTPACTDRSCDACRGCDYAGTFERDYSASVPPLPAGPVPDPSLVTAVPVRYAVVYEKTGRFRYLGHNDLVNALQRVFRRAGIEILHSEGFHPKPLMSFGPALPLGMEGKAEFFEFKSKTPLDPAALPARADAVAPPGLRFHSCVVISAGAPSWMERLREAVYTVDLKSAGLAETEALLRAFDDPAVREEAGAWLKEVRLDPGGERLRLRVAMSAQKIPRPQDLLGRLLALHKAVFHMTRESFAFEEPFQIDTNDRLPV
jgi:radical SAM-linked protein